MYFSKPLFFIFAITLLIVSRAKAESPPQAPISLFGTKPIQLSLDAQKGLVRKEGGFICELAATLGGGHYSEWGETEKDAQEIVLKKCGNSSGLLLCKRDKVTCKEEK